MVSISKTQMRIYIKSIRRLTDISAKLSDLAKTWHGIDGLNERDLLELIEKAKDVESAVKMRHLNDCAKVFRRVSVGSGRIVDVEFMAIGPDFYTAKADGMRSIIVKRSSHGWTAICFDGYNQKDTRHYHHAAANEAFALAANALWN